MYRNDGDCQCGEHRAISPQAWGCTEPRATRDRIRRRWFSISPQAWGCTDKGNGRAWREKRISPQAWGCTGRFRRDTIWTPGNLPTGVGMYRDTDSQHHANRGIISPQAWGCTGCTLLGGCPLRRISPQAWGCTDVMTRRGDASDRLRNLPTGVGMYRLSTDVMHVTRSSVAIISPQAWGCTEKPGPAARGRG